MTVKRVARRPIELIALELGPGEHITLVKDGKTQTGEVLIIDDREGEGDTAWIIRKEELAAYYEDASGKAD